MRPVQNCLFLPVSGPGTEAKNESSKGSGTLKQNNDFKRLAGGRGKLRPNTM